MPSVLITGTSRGIGLEFVRQYAADHWEVHACARDTGKGELAELAGKHATISLHPLDVTDHAGIDALAAELKETALDVLINNAGIFGPPGFGGTGQNLSGMDYALWRNSFETNTLAPFKMVQAFLPHLTQGAKKCVAMISTEMASLSGMKDSGMNSTCYQSSKAALNMTSLSLAHDVKHKGITVLMLHPGWVRTDMGGLAAPVSPKDSVKGLQQIISAATLKDSGRYCDYKDRNLPW